MRSNWQPFQTDKEGRGKYSQVLRQFESPRNSALRRLAGAVRCVPMNMLAAACSGHWGHFVRCRCPRAFKFEMFALLQLPPARDGDVHLVYKSGDSRTGVTARVGDERH